MGTLAMVGIGLCVGWAALWFWLGVQGRAHTALDQKLEQLER